MGNLQQQLSSAWATGGTMPDAHDLIQETTWVQASQRGDTLAFNRLVLKWERTVFNIALRMLCDREEAAEAAQEVFLAAYKSIRRFRGDCKFSTWLFRIAINHCISRSRRRPPGIQIPLEHGEPETAPPEQLRVAGTQEGDLLRAETRQRVQKALAFLPADQRAVVELKFYQDQTFEEMAAILQVPLSTVKSRLYAGLDLLKNRLGRTGRAGG